MARIETAYAKINLALHVQRRREDGYHEIETLFAFVDDGDRLEVAPAPEDRLTVRGEFAEGLSDGSDNLVMRALALARAEGADVPPLTIALEKNLPVAAGLGGGSADAGAMLRLILREWPGGASRDRLLAVSARLGADVPACVGSETAIGRGVGDDIKGVAGDDIAGRPVLLVNPMVPLATPPVFAGWNGTGSGPLAGDTPWAMTRAGANDLTASAIALCPHIDDVMTLLRAQLPLIARMSGSGATCFALFDSDAALEGAGNRIWDDHPDWWLMAGHLR